MMYKPYMGNILTKLYDIIIEKIEHALAETEEFYTILSPG